MSVNREGGEDGDRWAESSIEWNLVSVVQHRAFWIGMENVWTVQGE